MADMKQPMLSLKSVEKSFHRGTVNQKHVLKGIDLDLAPGDFVTIIGVFLALLVNLAAIHHRLGDGMLIDILQLVAKADTASDGGNLHARVAAQTVHQVEHRSLALDRSRDGDNHLAHIACRNAVEQQVDSQVGGRNALHRRNHTAQDVIHAAILVCLFD